MSLSEGTGRQVDVKTVPVGCHQGRIKVRAQTGPTKRMGVGGEGEVGASLSRDF